DPRPPCHPGCAQSCSRATTICLCLETLLRLADRRSGSERADDQPTIRSGSAHHSQLVETGRRDPSVGARRTTPMSTHDKGRRELDDVLTAYLATGAMDSDSLERGTERYPEYAK